MVFRVVANAPTSAPLSPPVSHLDWASGRQLRVVGTPKATGIENRNGKSGTFRAAPSHRSQPARTETGAVKLIPAQSA